MDFIASAIAYVDSLLMGHHSHTAKPVNGSYRYAGICGKCAVFKTYCDGCGSKFCPKCGN